MTTDGYQGSAQKGRRTARAGRLATPPGEGYGETPAWEGSERPESTERVSVSTVRWGLTSQGEFSWDAAQT